VALATAGTAAGSSISAATARRGGTARIAHPHRCDAALSCSREE
jgi:hypothetical protein